MLFRKMVFEIMTMAYLNIKSVNGISNRSFPSGFLIGVATSAYQIEGAWNESGKGESLWDDILHEKRYLIVDRTNGDVACDFYHKINEDIVRLKHLKINSYRFSISWARVIPTGKLKEGRVNKAGLQFYDELLQKLEEANIQPIVTLHHFDTPAAIHKEGFLIKENMNRHFVDYAKLMFQTFGDRVKYWVTFNEPNIFCGFIFGKIIQKKKLGHYPYLCGHNVIKSHAMVYRMYAKEFRDLYKGKITLTINCEWNEPRRDIELDRKAVQRKFMFEIGWFMHPLVHGDYPEILQERVRQYSSGKSRLPEFTKKEKKYINGTLDYFGLNYYTPSLVQDKPNNDTGRTNLKDLGIETGLKPTWEKTINEHFFVHSPSFRKMINWVNSTYSKIPIFITENGYIDGGKLNDEKRTKFLKDHMNEVLNAIHIDGIKIMGYIYWSFLDNFEWFEGYRYKFGLYKVAFLSPSRKRYEKHSVAFFKNIAERRRL